MADSLVRLRDPGRNGAVLGGLFMGGALLATVWLLLTDATTVHEMPMAVLVVLVFTAGVALFLRRARPLSPATSQVVLAGATLAVCLGTYLSGVPDAPGYLFLWATPYAFLFRPRVAVAHALLLGVGFALALGALAASAADPLPAGVYVSWWLLVVTTVVVVGLLVRRLTASVRASQKALLDSFENASSGLAAVGPDGRWLMVNRALSDLLGYAPDELAGRPVNEVTHPEDREETTALIGRMVSGAVDQARFEKRYVRRDGATVWVAVSSVPNRAPDGTIRFLFAQMQDVTARREAEDLLRESEERFASVFARAPVGMTVSDLRPGHGGRPLMVNRAACELFGVSEAELLARDPYDFVRPEDAAIGGPAWEDLLAGRASSAHIEAPLVRGDGTVFHAVVDISVVNDAQGVPRLGVTQIQDVTERHAAEERLREAEERFRTAFEEAGVGMALVGLEGRLIRVNRALCEMVGYTREELLSPEGPRFLNPPDHDVRLEEFERLVRGEISSYRRDRPYRHSDGRLLWGATTLSLVRDHDGAPMYAVAQIEDVTGRRRAQQDAERRSAQQAALARLGQLALVEEEMPALYRAMVEAIAETFDAPFAGLLEVVPGEAWWPVLCSVGWPEGASMPGRPGESMAAHTVEHGGPVLLEDSHQETRFDATRFTAMGIRSGACALVAGVDGSPCAVLGMHAERPRAFSGDDLSFLQAMANVLSAAMRRRAAERDLRHQSLHDPLTNLPNRMLLLDRVRQAMVRSRREGTSVAVLFLDLDDFKNINDSLGHDAGDELLRALAPRLSAALRDSDTLARFGGDEFVVLCEGLPDPGESVVVAGRLLDALAAPVAVGHADFPASASIGIAVAGEGHALAPEALLRDADVALYRAKAAGKGRFEVFDANMRAETLEYVDLTNRLRTAEERGHLRLVFQPIMGLSDGRVAGVESLLRWHDPEWGDVAPGRFIPLAEQSGLIVPIGAWVIREAIAQVARWRREGPPELAGLRVGVNVSRRQLSHPDLSDDIAAELARHDVEPQQLVLEVTESALMEDPGRAGRLLRELHATGVRISLDDFGTGQSSLSSLRDFPLNSLKLDRGFVTDLDAGGHASSIIRAVVDMAHSLDLSVVGEGVERPEEAAVLVELGCELGQGYLFSRPVAADELPAALSAASAAAAECCTNVAAAVPAAAGQARPATAASPGGSVTAR